MDRRIQPLSLSLFITDLILTPFGLFISAVLRSTIPFGTGGALAFEDTQLPLLVYLAAAVIWPVSLAQIGVYDPERVLRWFQEALRVVFGALIATAVLAGVLYMTFRLTSRLQFIYFFLVNLLMLLGYRAVLRISYRLIGRTRPGGHDRVLILGAGELGCRVAGMLKDHSRWGFDLVGFLDDDPEKLGETIQNLEVLGRIIDVKSTVEEKDVNEVWVALPVWALDRLNLILLELEKLPVRIKVVPDYFSMALVQAKSDVMDGIPVIGLREPVIEGMPRLLKRLFDICMGSLLALFALPAFAVVSLAVRMDSPGPILFRQQRVGENGRIFEMLKYRTMTVDAEQRQAEVMQETEEGQLLHKREDDPRVTRIGRLLRRYSLDELPQLFNVLKGEMSLVGPRPEMPWLVDRYDSWQRKRFAVPQGITGWWQINGRSDKPMHMNTEDDLYYVYNYSLWLDLQILLRTPLAVIRGKGAF
jgi:exopolysaccharide biosynthesis polyprenyl glycosylphosphotransferase